MFQAPKNQIPSKKHVVTTVDPDILFPNWLLDLIHLPNTVVEGGGWIAGRLPLLFYFLMYLMVHRSLDRVFVP